MFFTTDERRARQFFRIAQQKIKRWEPYASKLVHEAFLTESENLRKAIRNVAPDKVQHAAAAYLESDENIKLWLDVWKRINLQAGTDIWNFLEESSNSKEKKSLLFSSFPSIWQGLVFEFVKTQGGKLIKNITESTKEQIQDVLADDIANGKSTYEMEQDLEELYLDDIIPHREETIARTETARATNTATIEKARKYNKYSKKRWISVLDDRTRSCYDKNWKHDCPGHLEANGQEVELDEPFDVGGEELDRPGDPDASEWNTINCRCVMGVVPPDEYTAEMFAD